MPQPPSITAEPIGREAPRHRLRWGLWHALGRKDAGPVGLDQSKRLAAACWAALGFRVGGFAHHAKV